MILTLPENNEQQILYIVPGVFVVFATANATYTQYCANQSCSRVTVCRSTAREAPWKKLALDPCSRVGTSNQYSILVLRKDLQPISQEYY